ncbi:MAG: hypothetical protein V7K64_32410 [Nostoc sp.]|uniref:hypothetical protein n=1 Tax=Nostoc sp. TaxID=1180 RepID=UPI002FF7E4C1
MQFDSVLELKNEFLSKNFKDDLESKQDKDDLQPKAHTDHVSEFSLMRSSMGYFGFGYIAKGRNDYELDLRLQNPDKEMYRTHLISFLAS